MSHEAVLEMLRDPKFIEEYATKDEGQDSFQAVSMAQSGDIEREVELRTVQLDFTKLKMDCKPYYPNNLVFEMMI